MLFLKLDLSNVVDTRDNGEGHRQKNTQLFYIIWQDIQHADECATDSRADDTNRKFDAANYFINPFHLYLPAEVLP